MDKQDKILNKIFFYFLLFFFLLKNTVLLNSTISNVAFAGVILIFSAVYVFTYKLYNLRTSNLIFLLLFGLIISLGFYKAYHVRYSLFQYFYDVVRYITYIGIFLFGKYAYNNISLKGLSKWYVILILYHIITGFGKVVFGEIAIVHENARLGGEFENIGQFGMLLGLNIILLLIIFLHTHDLIQKAFMIFLMLTCLALLAFNDTMRVIASLAFAFFMFYVVYKKHYSFFFVMILLFLLLITVNKEVYTRLSSMLTSSYNIGEISNEKLQNSFQWRVLQWYLLIKDWYNNYFIMGVGLGQQQILHGFIAPWGEPFIAHSDVVKLLVETGLIGFPVLLIMYYWLYKFVNRTTMLEEFRLVFLYFTFCLATGNTLFSNPFQMFLFLIGYLTMEIKTNTLPEPIPDINRL